MMSETLTEKLEKLVKVQEQLCAEVMRLKAERDAAYAAGQKAERERCRTIANEFCKEVDPQDGSYIRHWPVTGDRIAAAIMEDKSDE